MDELSHSGVKGMRWGVIKARYQATQSTRNAKIAAAMKTGGAKKTSDALRFAYLKQPLHARIGMNAANAVRGVVLRETFNFVITGKSNLPKTKADFAKLAIEVAKKTATSTVIRDTLAKSALNRYDDKGQRIKGKWDGRKSGMTREDATEVSIMAARVVLPFVGRVAGLKLSEIGQRGKENRERVEKWGANILPEKVANIDVAWTSADGSVQVIDPTGKLK